MKIFKRIMSSPHDDIYYMEEDLDPNDDSPFV